MKDRFSFSILMLRALATYASRQGIALGDIHGALGDGSARRDNAGSRVPVEVFHAAWQEAVSKCSDRDFGLHFAETMQDISGSHILFMIMLNSPTVGNALNAFCRYHNLMNDVIRPRMIPSGDGILLSWDASGRGMSLGRHESEALLCILNSVFRRITGGICNPVKVTFQHHEPADISEHIRIFRAPLFFGQPASGIVIDNRHPGMPINPADPELLKILESYANTLIHRMYSPDTWADKVIRSISKHMCGQRPTIRSTANDLALSVRNLQNLLKEEGTTFQGLLDHVRKETALCLLKDRNMSLYDVSFLLGFSEQSSFNHAFRRWTGSTPKTYRPENDH